MGLAQLFVVKINLMLGGNMALKKSLPKKNARQKKMLHTVTMAKHDEHVESEGTSIEGKEDAIRRQLKVIQKDYMKLMTNVTKGYDLVKGWIETQASMRKDMIKSRLIKI